MPDLQIVIVRNQRHKPVQRGAAFSLSQAVDVLHVVADGEDGFPACHGVGADHRVGGG